jgi:hypothetical protein
MYLCNREEFEVISLMMSNPHFSNGPSAVTGCNGNACFFSLPATVWKKMHFLTYAWASLNKVGQ